MTGMSTRRRVYDRWDTRNTTIRLKAKNVSAVKNSLSSRTQDMSVKQVYS